MILKVVLTAALTLVLVDAATRDSFSRDDFPPNFFFGAATSAYQVEGAANEDGRTPSGLDFYFRYVVGSYGDVASDQYHKYKEDVALMGNMGLNAYRFSISWSRLIPNGKGPINPKGLEYYNNLINELTSHGIQPHVTLYHFDIPQALLDEYEGWSSRRSVEDFTRYADVCFREFGDRVKYWTTLNEPNMLLLMAGGGLGFKPYLQTHNMLLAHASAASLYSKKYQKKQHGFIGINVHALAISPLTNTTEDISATQRARDFFIGWILNPLFYGDYPEIMKKILGSTLPSFTKSESNLVKGSIDFLGINFYYTGYAKYNPNIHQVEKGDVYFADPAVELIEVSPDKSTFEIANRPWGLQRVLELVKHNYGDIPIYIHENGQQTQRNSSLADWTRVNYIQAHIRAVLESLRNGIDLRGYFVWSLLDVLELLNGYEANFGLYYVDLDDPSLRRQPRLSAHWYSHFLHNTVYPPKAHYYHSQL